MYRSPSSGTDVAPTALTVRVGHRLATVPATRTTETTPPPADSRTTVTPLPELDGYEILAELGRGGMGVVYKALQKGLNRVVALKMIVSGPAANADLLARFRSEAEVIARLQQPNIIQVYDIGTSAAGPYFAMEYAEGGNLAESWAGTPQPARLAARIIAMLACAVQAAHEQGVIHRDLKPANILLAHGCGSQVSGKIGKRLSNDPDQRTERDLIPKISDFGLARRLDGSNGLTLTGQVMGTPGYMAPEQARGGAEDVGSAADIYSLGVLLYEALTGGPPYRGVSGLESVHLMLSEEPLPPSRLRPGLPRDLETICLHCLQREPHKRYPTAGDLAEDLERFLAGEPIHARPTPAWERAWKWSRRHPATAGLAAALILAVAVGFGLVLALWRRAEAERDLTDDARRHAVELATSQHRAHHEAQVLSANLMLERGVGLCEGGEIGPGLLWLARARDMTPQDDTRLKQAARLLIGGWSRQLKRPLKVFMHDIDVETMALSVETEIIAAAPGNKIYLWKPDGSCACEHPLVHKQIITTLAFSPDGRSLLSGSRDGTVRLWDWATGRPRGEPFHHRGKVLVGAFSPNGTRILTAGSDGVVQVWDTATGRLVCGPFRQGSPVLSGVFSPDSKQIATSGEDGSVEIRELDSGRCRFDRLRHDGPVDVLTFSPDGRLLATGCSDKNARLWDMQTGQVFHLLSEHTGPIRALSFSPDGKTLATAGDDHKAILWDVVSGSPRARVQHQEKIWSIAFSPGGKALATASADYTARLWAADNGRPLGAPLPHMGDVNKVLFGAEGNTLLTASDDGMVRLWPTRPPGVASEMLPIGAPIYSLNASRDGSAVLICDKTGATHLWDPKGTTHREVAKETRASYAVFSPDSKRFLTVGWGYPIRLWDIATGASIGMPLPESETAISASFSPDGKYVVAGADDNDASVRVWDVASGSVLHSMTDHTRRVAAVAFSPDGQLILSASWDRTARLWKAADGSPVGEPMHHQDLIVCAAFSPDGKFAITGGDDYAARLWDVPTGQPLGPPLRHGEKVNSVAVNPAGTILLTVGTNGTARLWERSTGKPLGPALPYRGGLASGVFAADGTTFVTGGCEGIVRSWSVPSAIEADDEGLRVWLEAYTGLRLDSSGAVEFLKAKAWHEAYLASGKLN